MIHHSTHDRNLKGQFETKSFRICSFMYQLSFSFKTNYTPPKFSNIKCNNLLYHIMIKNFRSTFVVWFWLKVSHEVVLKMSAKEQSSENLTGAGGFTFFLSFFLRLLILIATLPYEEFSDFISLPSVIYVSSHWLDYQLFFACLLKYSWCMCIFTIYIFCISFTCIAQWFNLCVCVYIHIYILFQILFPYKL